MSVGIFLSHPEFECAQQGLFPLGNVDKTTTAQTVSMQRHSFPIGKREIKERYKLFFYKDDVSRSPRRITHFLKLSLM